MAFVFPLLFALVIFNMFSHVIIGKALLESNVYQNPVVIGTIYIVTSLVKSVYHIISDKN